MSERLISLDGERFGVLSAPAGAGKPSLLFLQLNAGSVHRQGPFRLHVTLARRFAAAGIPCFRFDQPGIGDSIAAAERPQVEVLKDVLDRLQAETGIGRFCVGGICSAADAGWWLALADPRVCGLVLLDPLARTGLWFKLAKLLQPRSLQGWLALLKRRARSAGDGGGGEAAYREWPRFGEEAGQLQRLVDRGVEVFALYTGGAAHYFLDTRQFNASYGAASRDPKVAFAHWPEVDHLFYRPDDRDRLIQYLLAWMQRRLLSTP
jgi:pimeloyl-ACP methyl ester carboxylesterase